MYKLKQKQELQQYHNEKLKENENTCKETTKHIVWQFYDKIGHLKYWKQDRRAKYRNGNESFMGYENTMIRARSIWMQQKLFKCKDKTKSLIEVNHKMICEQTKQ
jgi:hypothetical protein